MTNRHRSPKVIQVPKVAFSEDRRCAGRDCPTVFGAKHMYTQVYRLRNKLGIYYCSAMCAMDGVRVSEAVSIENADTGPLDYMKEQGWLEGFAKGTILHCISVANRDSIAELDKAIEYIEMLRDMYND